MEQTIHESGHNTPQKDADLVQVAAVALQRCTGDDTPAEQLIRLLLLSYQQCKGLLTPASIAEPLESFRRQSKANVEAARQIAKLKPWLLQATDAELAEELSFDLDDHTEPGGDGDFNHQRKTEVHESSNADDSKRNFRGAGCERGR